jgi:hypothetical protein
LEADTIETLKSRKLSVLKGRGGELGSVNINFDADKMEFGEIVEEELSDLQVE